MDENRILNLGLQYLFMGNFERFEVFGTGFLSYLMETAGLEQEQAQRMAADLERKKFRKGEILLQPGEVCQHSFFVEKGLLRAYMMDESGKEHVIQFAPENWFIVDRSSVYFNDPSETYIEAIEDS